MASGKRIVEAYVGEYASGKSEISINRALELREIGHVVTLVDLDVVEPFYTLRPLMSLLTKKDLHVITMTDSFGLGETGAMLNPKARWALRHEGDIIMDIGYGVHGAGILNLVEGASTSSELQILAVLNFMRPMTSSQERIINYLRNLGRIDGIIANTHLAEQTSLEIVKHGYDEILAVSRKINIPIKYVTVDITLKDQIKPDFFFHPLKYIKRYMPQALW